MDRESMDRLRLDQRLRRRRGWVKNTDVESALEALPDVSHKLSPMTPLEDEGDAPAKGQEPTGA